MDALLERETDESGLGADVPCLTAADSKDTLLKELNHETSLEINASKIILGVHLRNSFLNSFNTELSEDTSGNAASPEFPGNLVLDSPNLKKAESTIAVKEYVHEELLGEGNTHRVYKSTQDGRPVALKVRRINHECQNQEWSIFAFLKQEYLISYYCKHDGFLVTELCEGSIYKMVDNRKEINITNRMILGKELILIIQELHHRNIVHASLTEHKICLTMPETIGEYHIRLLGSSKSYISANTMRKREDIINAGKMVAMIIRWCSLETELVHEDLPLWNDLVKKMVNAEYEQIDEVFFHPLLSSLRDRKNLKLGSSRESQTDEVIDQYQSRFVLEYEEIVILGCGGFGMVFKAKNKLDGHCYAIKRICPPKEGAEDINREVEALAKLKHDNIVRYYIAWIERPPYGWQKQKDMTWSKDSEVDEIFAESLSRTSQNMSENRKIDAYTATNELGYSKDCDSYYEELSKANLPSLSALDDSDDNVVFENSNNNNNIDFKDVGNNSVDSFRASMNVPDFNEIATTGNSINNDCRQENENLFLYIQMEWCEKRTLKKWLCENIENRDISDALAKFEQITSAVQYIHDKEFMHRDMKPANIFLSHDDKIKVGDFGLAKALPPMMDAAGCAMQCHMHSTDIGTKLYMSPELKQGSYSLKVDIYALGLILLELIYPMTTEFERIKTLESAKEGTFPKTDDKRLEKMFEYVNCLLSSDPEQRPSAKDILESVKSL